MYHQGGTVIVVAALNPRIQVTVDDALAQAMARIEPDPGSRSRLVRDLAMRGAQAVEQEREQAADALQVLLDIADGALAYDFDAAADLVARRGDRLP